MNAVRVVARRQVRSLMLAAGVRSCVPAFAASPSMQLRTAKKQTSASNKAVLLKQKKAAKKAKLALKAKANIARKAAKKKALKLKARNAARLRATAKKLAAAAKKRERAAKKRAALKAKADAKKAVREKKRAEKKAIRASGAVTPFSLFVQETTRGKKSKTDMKSVAAEWKALSEGQKQKYLDQAKQNLFKRRATKQSMKKSPNKYALFTKQHFSAEYTAARKNTTNLKDAFKAASRAVAKKFKSQ